MELGSLGHVFSPLKFQKGNISIKNHVLLQRNQTVDRVGKSITNAVADGFFLRAHLSKMSSANSSAVLRQRWKEGKQ